VFTTFRTTTMATMALIVALALALALGACGGDQQQNAGGGAAGTDDASEATVATGGKVGNAAPGFALARLDGSTLDLAELRGKTVLLDFWATWCPPCRMAMPHLQALSQEYADQLVVVGIAMDQGGAGVVGPFVTKEQLSFEVVIMDANVIRDYGGISSIPTTFLIDPQGRIVNKWIGYQNKAVYEGAIKKVLAS
jgi:cytochrome c biogenesis protein CcmG/thiol:disulfide interchange protein DsbE